MKIKLLFKDSEWNLKNTILFLCFMVFINFNTNAQPHNIVDGGEISTTDNTTVCVGDGIADLINVTLTGASGRVMQWIITDYEENILALPEAPPFDFEGADAGICKIWHLSYNGIKPLVDPSGQNKFIKNLSELVGRYDLSNYIEVERQQKPTGGTLEGGPFEFCVGDGEADHIPEGAITLSGNSGTNSQWVVTNADGTIILGLPPNSYTQPNFDGAGAGTCLVWHLTYEDGLEGLVQDGLVADLMGCFEFSNSIPVVRLQPEGGTLEGGPFEFCVGDGEADHIAEGTITLSGNSGTNSQWVVTDYEFTKILGLPGNYTGSDFDGAGAGICKVWHLSYEDGLQGLVMDGLVSDLVGCFEFSNAIEVIRIQPEGGTLEGGPFAFTVGDNTADHIPADAITLTGNIGANSKWVVTNADGTTILGLPDNNYTDVDFDGAGAGTCLVWHLSYEDGLQGLVKDSLVVNLAGCYSFSNSISVVRTASAGRFVLYPNPTKGLVNIDLSNFVSRDVSIKIYNLLSVQMFNRNFGFRSLRRSALTSIDISNYLEGIYFVSITDNISGKSFVKRLIVK